MRSLNSQHAAGFALAAEFKKTRPNIDSTEHGVFRRPFYRLVPPPSLRDTPSEGGQERIDCHAV